MKQPSQKNKGKLCYKKVNNYKYLKCNTGYTKAEDQYLEDNMSKEIKEISKEILLPDDGELCFAGTKILPDDGESGSAGEQISQENNTVIESNDNTNTSDNTGCYCYDDFFLSRLIKNQYISPFQQILKFTLSDFKMSIQSVKNSEVENSEAKNKDEFNIPKMKNLIICIQNLYNLSTDLSTDNLKETTIKTKMENVLKKMKDFNTEYKIDSAIKTVNNMSPNTIKELSIKADYFRYIEPVKKMCKIFLISELIDHFFTQDSIAYDNNNKTFKFTPRVLDSIEMTLTETDNAIDELKIIMSPTHNQNGGGKKTKKGKKNRKKITRNKKKKINKKKSNKKKQKGGDPVVALTAFGIVVAMYAAVYSMPYLSKKKPITRSDNMNGTNNEKKTSRRPPNINYASKLKPKHNFILFSARAPSRPYQNPDNNPINLS